MLISPGFKAYVATYLIASLLAFVILIRERQSIVLLSVNYRRYLLTRWKVVTFAIAAISMTVMAPYTGDPTWDYVDAAFMSILTFLTAPWAVGTIFLALRGKSKPSHVFVAVCLWMISASWAYDVYILLMHGYYPPTWASNIVLSSILYCCAGLMWNLQKKPGTGVVFGFMAADWPNPDHELGIKQIIWFALPIMALVSAMILPFLL